MRIAVDYYQIRQLTFAKLWSFIKRYNIPFRNETKLTSESVYAGALFRDPCSVMTSGFIESKSITDKRFAGKRAFEILLERKDIINQRCIQYGEMFRGVKFDILREYIQNNSYLLSNKDIYDQMKNSYDESALAIRAIGKNMLFSTFETFFNHVPSLPFRDVTDIVILKEDVEQTCAKGGMLGLLETPIETKKEETTETIKTESTEPPETSLELLGATALPETISTSEPTVASASTDKVELLDQETKKCVLLNAKNLKRFEKYKKVYLNKDKTPTERAFERTLREERNNKNKELPNVVNGSEERLRFANQKTLNDENNNQLKCLYTNATSLNSDKVDKLSLLASTYKPHIIFINETWFKEDSLVSIENYYLHKFNRNDNISNTNNGGGVAIYVHDNYGNETIKLGCIYRPPLKSKIIYNDEKSNNTNIERSNQADDEIIQSIQTAKIELNRKIYTGILICGDFNFPYIKWYEDGSVQVNGNKNSIGARVVDLINNINIIQNVTFPTFIQKNKMPKNILDLVITESSDRIKYIENLPPLGLASQGHLILKFNYDLSSNKDKTSYLTFKYNYHKSDFNSIIKCFQNIDWLKELSNLTINESYNLFLNHCNYITNMFVPKVICKNKNKPLWLNRTLVILINKKNRLWRKNQSSKWKIPELVEQYKKLKSSLQVQKRLTIKKFEHSLAFDTKNPKRLFSYVNSSRKIKQSIKSIRNNYGVTGTDGRFIADTLNDQFKSVFNNNSVNKDSPLLSNRTTERLSSLHFSIDEIKNKLKNLNPNKTTGPDNVHPMILKQCANVLSLPLTIIYNKSLSERSIPHAWRNANVTPLFKKGDTNEPSNYRPVSLRSIPCKLMESLVTNDIVNHLSKLNLISQSQHGFVKNKACVTNLLESNDYITKCLANKNAVDVVYLDFSKAFDTISHKLLIIKLKAYGIVGDLLDWIEDFLTDRKQRVVLGEHVSDWAHVTSGVPHGSVLGPILFIIYINDLPDNLKCVSKLYADDSKLMNELRVKNIPNDTTDIQIDLNKITEWTKVWLIKLNLEKCKVMHMASNNPRSNYSLQDTTNYLNYDLEKSDVEKDLGIFVSSNAKYFNQVIHASNKANRMLNMLKKHIYIKGFNVMD
ncbi:uncharacterized protein LOC136075750 [Hydra vulgaris]|uniref:Uncharacterized protein LOC136075750 n=1 Tax=Hydra vulgaris TaxID=6087 RepID=A0ABM4B8P9_HYDVU